LVGNVETLCYINRNCHEKINVPGVLDLKIGEEITWCIRPDDVMVLQEYLNPGKAIAENIFSGKIIEIVSKGSTYLLFIDGIFGSGII